MENRPDDQKYKRITQPQLRYFINFAKKNPDIMRSKATTVHTKQYIDKLWEQLAEVLNDMHGPKRTPARWRDAMRNWKKQLRCRTKKAIFKNPDDTALLEVFEITDFDQEALEVFGFVKTEGPECTNMQFEEECEIECIPITQTTSQNEPPAKEIFENIGSGSNLLHPISPNSSSSDGDDSNHSEDSGPPKKRRKYSTQQMFTLVLESMRKREEREEKMVEALLKLGEGLLAVANAIAQTK